MSGEIWLPLNSDERTLLREALTLYSVAEGDKKDLTRALMRKLKRIKSRHVTIRMEGGFVEEIKDNPIPIRLYDYDCDGVDVTDRDERGKVCVISEFGPDNDTCAV